MGRNASTSTNTNNKGKEEKSYIEFNYSSGANAANGRIYLENEYATDAYSTVPISMTLNGLAIRGCKVYIPREKDKTPGIMFPAFKNKDGEYTPIMYMYEKDDITFLRDLAKHIVDKCK